MLTFSSLLCVAFALLAGSLTLKQYFNDAAPFEFSCLRVFQCVKEIDVCIELISVLLRFKTSSHSCLQGYVSVTRQSMTFSLFFLPYTTFITQPDSIPFLDNKWRTDKVTFLCLFSLISVFWLAEQSHRQTETCRISGASKWVSCIDRKWGLLWGQCIDFLACQVWVQRKEQLPVEKNAMPAI